jgi:hypothetical protein
MVFLKPAAAATQKYEEEPRDRGREGYFKGSRFRKSVDIIVGLKIAKGQRLKPGQRGAKRIWRSWLLIVLRRELRLRWPTGGEKVDKEEMMEWKDEKSFAFAYWLRKITCKKGKLVADAAFNKVHSSMPRRLVEEIGTLNCIILFLRKTSV